MSSLPYDWTFNANKSGMVIPGLVSADANGNVTITGNISTNSGIIYSNSSGTLTATSFSGDITNTSVTYTDSTGDNTNLSVGTLLPTLNYISNNFDTHYYYDSYSRIDSGQIISDGNGLLSVNNLDIGNQESTSLVLSEETYDDTASGSSTIHIINEYVLDTNYSVIVSGTGIQDNTTIISVSTGTADDGNGGTDTYYILTLSKPTTEDIPTGSTINITRTIDKTTVNFYTSGNTTPVSTITIIGSKGNTSSTMSMTAGDVSFDYNSLTTNITKIILTNIPTSDPKVMNQLWNNGGVLMLSQG